jgi:hypothetical protein
MSTTYAQFFQEAFQRARAESQSPYAYQCRLGGQDSAAAQAEVAPGTGCKSLLITLRLVSAK